MTATNILKTVAVPIFLCMGALADDVDGNIPGEIDGKFEFDERFLQFGDHVLPKLSDFI